jgi:oxygen-independent coproporphyrinogen-3 oxidase
VEFHDGVGPDSYLERLSQANAAGSTEPLSLYTHLPFCDQRCLFCGCHVVITPHMPVAEKYLSFLMTEIERVAGLLPNRRQVAQLQWGGGTPTYFSPDQLAGLMMRFQDHFDFVDGAEIAIEVDPRVTSHDHLERLSELGFNRLSMGVQDFTPEVQRAITRGQTYEETADLMRHARELGFSERINLDLVYGLPEQRLETFDENLSQVLELRPSRAAVYSFAYVPWVRGHQKKIAKETLPNPDLKLRLYLLARERFLEAGYVAIGMDHFALPGDELAVATGEGRLHRNFVGYSVMPASDLVAFGISGIGDVQGAYFQNEKKLSQYYRALDSGSLPVQRGYVLTKDDKIRREVIREIMCNFRLSKLSVEERFGIDFDAYFRSSLDGLSEMSEAGLVELGAEALVLPPRGRLFVRNVCMAFDAYLSADEGSDPVFSRTV